MVSFKFRGNKIDWESLDDFQSLPRFVFHSSGVICNKSFFSSPRYDNITFLFNIYFSNRCKFLVREFLFIGAHGEFGLWSPNLGSCSRQYFHIGNNNIDILLISANKETPWREIEDRIIVNEDLRLTSCRKVLQEF